MYSKELTKEMLKGYGITKVTRDGRIFKGKEELEQKENIKEHQYGEPQVYKAINLVDKNIKLTVQLKNGKTTWTYKTRRILVNRIVYAWYKGIVHEGMEIGYKNQNTLDNRLKNLEEVTPAANRQKKVVSRNQYTKGLTDEEILANRKVKNVVYDRESHNFVANPEFVKLRKEVDQKKLDLKYYMELSRDNWKNASKDDKSKCKKVYNECKEAYLNYNIYTELRKLKEKLGEK